MSTRRVHKFFAISESVEKYNKKLAQKKRKERIKLKKKERRAAKKKRIENGRNVANQTSILHQLLSSSTGRSHLAQSMAQPLMRRMNYESIARQALIVEPLPEGALPIYDRD
jgi:hypothetical protein